MEKKCFVNWELVMEPNVVHRHKCDFDLHITHASLFLGDHARIYAFDRKMHRHIMTLHKDGVEFYPIFEMFPKKKTAFFALEGNATVALLGFLVRTKTENEQITVSDSSDELDVTSNSSIELESMENDPLKMMQFDSKEVIEILDNTQSMDSTMDNLPCLNFDEIFDNLVFTEEDFAGTEEDKEFMATLDADTLVSQNVIDHLNENVDIKNESSDYSELT